MVIFVSIILVALTFVLLIIMLTEMVAFVRSRVPFVPTSAADILDMAERLSISSRDFVFDLGSGNGKVVFLIEKTTGARVRGIQYGGWTQWYAHLKKLFTKSKAELVNGNFFKQPWQDATVIYGYLFPPLMSQVGAKAMEECRPGTKILTRDFPITTMEQIDEWQTPSGHKMYLYII